MKYPQKENFPEDNIYERQADRNEELEAAKNIPVKYIETTYATVDNGFHEDEYGCWNPSLWFVEEKNKKANLDTNIESTSEYTENCVKTRESILLSEGDLADFLKLDVDIDAYLKFREIKNKAKKFCSFFPGYILCEGIFKAIETKATDLLAALSLAKNNQDFKIEDINRAFRDFDFLLDSIYMALGGDIDWELDSLGKKTFCNALSGRKYNNGGYESSYRVISVTEFDEGDFVEVSDDKKDNWDRYVYEGILNIQIDPSRRISFDYIPDQRSARDYHETETTITHKDGEQLKYKNNGLSLRIDIDKTAPCGIALDVGRSSYDAAKSDGAFSRTGDLLGNIFSKVSPNGCHEYVGFTAEMAENFKSFAEDMVLGQYLRFAQDRS